jgi:hypothetical protein
LRKGKNLNAVLLFWKIKEKRYEYPINENAKRANSKTKYPVNLVTKFPSSPNA